MALGPKQLRWLVMVLFCSNLATILLLCLHQLGLQGAARRARLQDLQGDALPCGEKQLQDLVTARVVKLRQQRVSLSRDLNQAKRTSGRAVCEKLYLEKSVHPERFQGSHHMPRSDTGGWCREEGKESNAEHKTDLPLALALSRLLANKTVASFGDGPGAYRRAVLTQGKVRRYDAYDGAPYCEETSGGRVRFLDLTAPQFGLELYDWVVSLEVAEHIPPKFEAVFLDNLVRHAREGLVLSWARPGQDGVGHVNGRSAGYVQRALRERGFALDREAGQRLRSAAILEWLATNIQVFRRTEPASADPAEA